jgi:hypothetical protein
MTTARTDLRLAAVFCGVLGLYDLSYVLLLLFGGPLIGPRQDVLYPDFLVFHAAAHAWAEGKAALIYDIEAFTHLQNVLYADRFGRYVDFRPFFYPPVWLLLLLPLGRLAVGAAYALFMAVTGALAVLLGGGRDPWRWLAVMTSPAAVWTALAGQNTFLSLGLLYGGLRLLDRAPMAAGMLLGVLAYKPQVWLLVPLALLAARRWQALAWAGLTVAVLSLASLGLFGLDLWHAFVDSTRQAVSPAVADRMFHQMYMQMTTLMAAGRILGLPSGVAGAIQLAGAVSAVVAVWVAFRRYEASEARTAVLASATFLVSPYTLNYDLLLLMPAAVALFRRGAAEGFLPAERLVYFALWLLPTLGVLANRHALPIMPPIIMLFGLMAWMRLQAAAKVELPEPAAAR